LRLGAVCRIVTPVIAPSVASRRVYNVIRNKKIKEI
jgi:hypothetical protein